MRLENASQRFLSCPAVVVTGSPGVAYGGLCTISAAVPEPMPKEPLLLTPKQRWAIGLIGVGVGVILYRRTTA